MKADRQRSLAEVFGRLEAEGYLEPGWQEQVGAAMATFDQKQPWYVRAMVGFGAWFASLLLIVFIMSVDFVSTSGGHLRFGLMLVAAAVMLRRSLVNDFARQTALALSLAGQVFMAIGMDWFDLGDDFELAMLALILINSLLIKFYPDSVHRFLSVIIIMSSWVGLLYYWETQFLLSWLTPLLTIGFVYLVLQERRFVVDRKDLLIRPIAAGLMVSAFGCVMLSTVYIIPELILNFEFYPHPWVTTLACGLILLYLEQKLLGKVLREMRSWPAIVVSYLTLLLMTAALAAPGLIFSLIVILLGTAQGNRSMSGAGLAFLTIFTAAFFYGIQTTMLMKSAMLVLTGLTVLLGRALLLYALRLPQEHDDA
ncbi:MAG: DUF4401 domain-containing protein [Gammaproteobacteria bacterium]